MLTGQVTMLMWSFVRDDQSRSETCRQIALTLRAEVESLEAAGIAIIQVVWCFAVLEARRAAPQ